MEKKKYSRPEISREELQEQLFDANLQLQAANDRLLQEERIRTELFANLSHDLRSPLTALASSIGYLQTGTVSPEETQSVLHIMEKRTKYLQTLVADMFLLAKMENSDTRLQLEQIDAAAFLEEYFYSCEADVLYEDRQLRLEIPEDLSVEVCIDPQMMVRVLDNLFTNARKYSASGASICLCVSCGAGELRFSVRDTGIGIAPEELPHIFERSFRSTKARTPGDDSSGLGLSIAQKIVERHGGTIHCESTPGEGTCFTVTLPTVTHFACGER